MLMPVEFAMKTDHDSDPHTAQPDVLGMAFEGCGCRAAFHVGVIEWCAEHHLLPGVVAGASSGALIAGATAIGRIADLRHAWSELLDGRVCDLRRVLRGRWPFRMSEIVGDAATRYFGTRLLAHTLVPLAIVITELRATGFRRRALTASDHLQIATAVRASCFIPGPYSRIVPIDRRLSFDGAWLGRVPILEAARLGARRVVACVSDDAGRLLRGALWTKPMALPRDVDCRVLSPVAPLPTRTFDFDRVATLETFAIGRASAEAFATANHEWLRPATTDDVPHRIETRPSGMSPLDSVSIPATDRSVTPATAVPTTRSAYRKA